MIITTIVRIAYADDETLRLVLGKLEQQCAFIRSELDTGVARDDH